MTQPDEPAPIMMKSGLSMEFSWDARGTDRLMLKRCHIWLSQATDLQRQRLAEARHPPGQRTQRLLRVIERLLV
jgi:hypothetical protein